MNWDSLAASYGAQVWLERAALRAALDLARPCPAHRLLDIGTGTGALLEMLARRADRPRQAVGVDSSAAMLARVAPLPPDWRVIRGDARSLPFEPGSFDVATLSYVLHVLEAQERVATLCEAHRVLATGGVLVTVTPTLPLPSGNPIHRRIVRRLESDTGSLRGLLPLDPRADLAAVGFEVQATRRAWLGYPSLCVRARRR